MTDTTVEAVQQTLAEYERIAISTGEWNGTDAPEFSDDGQTWTPAWLPTDEEHAHPLLVRATVYRKGVDRPIVVVVRWDEAVPAIGEWRDLWLRKPIALFGAFGIRASLRRGFRDVIGDRHEPDESIDVPEPLTTDRDWLADLAELETPEGVHQLHKIAKEQRAVTVELERAIRHRLAELTKPAESETATPRPAEAAVPSTSRPKPAPPKVRLEDTVRRPKNGRRPQKPKPRRAA